MYYVLYREVKRKTEIVISACICISFEWIVGRDVLGGGVTQYMMNMLTVRTLSTPHLVISETSRRCLTV